MSKKDLSKVRKELKSLNEDTLIQAVQKDMAKQLQREYGKLEYELDRALDSNLELKEMIAAGESNPIGWVNILISGTAGVGKTARIKQWAEKNGVKLVQEDVKGMDISDIGGAISPDKETGTKAIKLGTTQFDDLDFTKLSKDEKEEVRNAEAQITEDEYDDRYAVLFLDELNRGLPEVRGSLLTLVADHEVPDPTVPGHMRYLPGFLFTVAAINPSGSGNYEGVTKLDLAERTRFYIVHMTADIPSFRDFLLGWYDKQIKVFSERDKPYYVQKAVGRRGLAETILNSSQFSFDALEEETEANENETGITTPRTLALALQQSDGTKDDFLHYFEAYCNPTKMGLMKTILGNYKDVANKANSVFSNASKEHSASLFQKKEPSTLDKFRQYKKDNGI